MDTGKQSHATIVASLEKKIAAMEKRERRLVAKNSLLRQLYDDASLNIQSLDANGCFISVNQAWLDALGYSRDEVLGKNFSEFLHPDWQDHFRENFPKFKAVGEILGVEFHMKKKDGSFMLVSFNGKVVRDSKGNFNQTYCIFQDITQQKQLDEAMARSEKKWQNIIFSIPLLGINLDPQGRIIFVNSHFSKIVGWSEEELVGKDWFDTFIPKPKQCEVRKGCFTEMEPNDFLALSSNESEIVTRAGEVRYVHWSNVISKDGKGNVTGITSLGLDLTEQKMATDNLRESQELIERIIHTIPWRVSWKDTNLVYLGCNTHFAKDAGFDDPSHIIGKDDFMMGWRDQAELYRSDDFEVIKSGQPKLFIEEPQTTTDGNTIHLLTCKVPLRNLKGEISGVLGTYIDITERKEMEMQNENLQIQLNHVQKMEAIGQLAAGIAHEINTPSQYLESNLSFLNESFEEIESLLNHYEKHAQEEEHLSDDKESFAHQIAALSEQFDREYLKEEIPKAIQQSQDGLAKIRSIVLAMKEFSHPGSKEKQSIDVNRLIDTILTISSNEWKYLAEVDKQLNQDLPQVPCLPNELGQVFLNILVNAAHAITDKFSNYSDNRKGLISITTRTIEGSIEITFTDNGCGIPEDIRQKIFTPFFTTKEVGRGTGQGLAIAYDIIVNKHGGKIECTSTPGEGATISLRLPQE